MNPFALLLTLQSEPPHQHLLGLVVQFLLEGLEDLVNLVRRADLSLPRGHARPEGLEGHVRPIYHADLVHLVRLEGPKDLLRLLEQDFLAIYHLSKTKYHLGILLGKRLRHLHHVSILRHLN